MNIESEWLNRTERLVGSDIMHNITTQRVIILGVGGVGSWCAESLIRSGIKQLTIVDADCVCVSNINRQLMATTRTVGQAKVEALKERLLDINPEANIRLAAGRKLLPKNGATAFCAGASASITGNMLTTSGTTIKEDMAMIAKLGLTNREEDCHAVTGTCGAR